jgi:hypothetical protein
MPVPIALLLPLVPVLVEAIVKIVQGARESGELTPAQRAKLDEIAARLDQTNAEVQALEIRDV